jgi:diguanylate cyclase (GGDEF)-like protein
VERIFHRRGLASGIIERTDGTVAVLMHTQLLNDLVGPLGYGHSLYFRRAVEVLVPNPALVLPAATDLVDAEVAAMDRDTRQRFEDIVVHMEDDTLGLVPIADLVRALSEKYAHQALHDPLTGLPNRAYFIRSVQQALRDHRDTGQPLAVLFLDVDRFKTINDGLGHAGGDAFLRHLGTVLRRHIREQDMVARLAGDEFAILLTGIAAKSGERVAEHLLVDLSEPVTIHDQELRVGVSIGLACADPAETHDPEQLLRRADTAMYRAKMDGGRSFVSYSPMLVGLTNDWLELEAALAQAVARDELVLRYQPKALGEGEIMEVEALLRWDRPGYGMLSPASFIPLAERTGLIRPIGRWVLQQACLQAAKWRKLRPDQRPLTMCVNVSVRQLTAPGILNDVADALSASGCSPDSLCLEVTETAVTSDDDAVVESLTRLRGLGVRIAIDDFGVGNSSFGRLKDFPADELKIDRSFINDLASGEVDEKIVAYIVQLAHACGMTVTAEGVETESQRALLRRLGCDLLQGYLISHPLTPVGLEVLLDASSSVHSVQGLAHSSMLDDFNR